MTGLLAEAWRADRIRALFFGDFLLGPQKKLTRRAAATGGLSQVPQT
jgi:hypothetical protein